VALEHEVDRPPRRGEGRVVEGALREQGRVARRHQEQVALAQGHLEALGEVEHHLAARRGASALHEAEVLLRDLGLEGEVELAHPAALAPGAQVPAEGARLGGDGGDGERST
jgi:hypothetical protein